MAADDDAPAAVADEEAKGHRQPLDATGKQARRQAWQTRAALPERR
jgi:hypothetical protein